MSLNNIRAFISLLVQHNVKYSINKLVDDNDEFLGSQVVVLPEDEKNDIHIIQFNKAGDFENMEIYKEIPKELK